MTTLKRSISVVFSGLFLEDIVNHENPFRCGKATFLFPSPTENNFCPYTVLIMPLTRKYVV